MSNTEDNNNEFINPIDKDNISENPHSLTYGHHRGSLPVKPTKEGQIKSKALSAMEHQTDMQLDQIRQQMALLAEQAKKLQDRKEISERIYAAEMRFEPLINHVYELYQKDDNKHLLSMVAPNQWGRKGCPFIHIATVRLLADHTWEVV